MPRLDSPRFKRRTLDAREPSLSVEQFKQRCKDFAVRFSEVLNTGRGEISFIDTVESMTAVMTLGGRRTERVERNRGLAHHVAPLCVVTGDIFAWFAYRELWVRGVTEQKGAAQKFRFHESGFTFHIGRAGDLSKPQVLRVEWVGRRGNGHGNGAGHPHWQLDALESARTPMRELGPRFIDPDLPRPPLPFESEAALVIGANLLLGLTIERMHLASAARWWCADDALTHSPKDVAEIDRWALGCVAYLRQEAARLAVVAVPA